MRRLIYVMGFLVMTSCVSVPKAAPELSQQLGVQLRQLETAHLALDIGFLRANGRKSGVL